jgi:hypothetical protein
MSGYAFAAYDFRRPPEFGADEPPRIRGAGRRTILDR